jgi:hypothetical protein
VVPSMPEAGLRAAPAAIAVAPEAIAGWLNRARTSDA